MFEYYYAPRWHLYFDYIREILKDPSRTFNGGEFHRELFENVELPFQMAKNQSLIQHADCKLIFLPKLIFF